jgi:hypothetical protein
METTFAQSPLAASTASLMPIQWLGIQWQGGFYAVPLKMIAAVFRAAHAENLAERKILDIEIHAGAAVFMKSFTDCFDVPLQFAHEDSDEERRWVLVMNTLQASQIGCRIHQVVGPFWADPHSSHVAYDGKQWLQIQLRAPSHA